MKNKKLISSKNLTAISILIILGLTIYVLLPQLRSFSTSIQTLKSADKTLILAALISFSLTYFIAAKTLQLLANFSLRYRSTLLIQIADGFTNKLVPAGIGAVTTNYLYLKQQSRSDIKAGYVAIVNNLIGFVAHILLLIVLLLINRLFGRQTIKVHFPTFSSVWLIVFCLLSLLVVIFWWLNRQPAIKRNRRVNIKNVVGQSLKHPFRLLGSLGTSTLITLLYSLTLFMVMLALNVHLTFLQAFLIFTISVGAQAIVPTPGGIGGVEASLVGSMIAFGVNSSPSLSVALAFRFITYWLPIIPGVICLESAYKQQLINK